MLKRDGDAALLYLAARQFAAFQTATLGLPRGPKIAEVVDQLRLGEFDLVAVGQIFQSPGALGDFVFAQDQSELGAELVGLAEGFAEFEFGGRDFDGEASVAEIFGGADGGGVGSYGPSRR